MINEKEFNSHLQSLTRDDWNRLFSLLPKIEVETRFGEIKGGHETTSDAIQMPYWSNSAIVNDFLDVYHNLDLCIVFDWTQWDEGFNILKEENFDFSKLDTLTLCKLLTTIIRADRFNDGFLVVRFADGTVPKIVHAIAQNEQHL